MKCQNCNEKEANVRFTKIINGEKTEVLLCKECAKKTGEISFELPDAFSFQNIFAGLLNPHLEDSSIKSTEEGLKCDNCGLTFKKISQEGLTGCSNCYDKFGSRFDSLVKRIHGSIEHHGKVPKRMGGDLRIKKEISSLKKNMEKAVEKENFERAAELRDKIKELRNELGGK